jgi:hypothetical protein
MKKMKVRIKEEFKDKKIYISGTYYDLSSMSDKQLITIYNHIYWLREFLEEVIIVPIEDQEVLLNNTEFKKTIKTIRKKKSK